MSKTILSFYHILNKLQLVFNKIFLFIKIFLLLFSIYLTFIYETIYFIITYLLCFSHYGNRSDKCLNGCDLRAEVLMRRAHAADGCVQHFFIHYITVGKNLHDVQKG